MSYKRPPFPLFETHLNPRIEIKSGGEGRDLIPKAVRTDVRKRGKGEVSDLARYLAANPGMTVRDYKGKGFHAYNPFDKHHVRPNEEPWDRLDRAEVRRIATSSKARFLPRNIRQAAARDPGLEWDAQGLAYRLRSAALPAPFPANGDDQGEGGEKAKEPSPTRPASCCDVLPMTVSPRIFDHD